jgi:hypothetical protein
MKFVKAAGKKKVTQSGKNGNMNKFIYSGSKRKGRR